MRAPSIRRGSVSGLFLVPWILLPGPALAGLRHHWALDETEGLAASDQASGADGSLVNFEENDDSQWVGGQFEGGLNLGAGFTFNNYVAATVPALSAAATGGFTVALWIQPGGAILAPGEYQLLSTPGDVVGFTIYNNVVEGTPFDRVLLFWDSSLPNLAVGSTSLEPGTWYHVAITSTGAGGVKEYYVDGVREEKRMLVPSQGGADMGAADGWAAGEIEIGGIGGAGRTHDSIIDDVRIYDHALSEAEIVDVVSNPPAPAPRISRLVPAAGDTFHDPTDGFRFQADAVAAGSTLPVPGIHLTLNGADVTADLAITGTEASRTISYTKLVAETLYEARIEVTDSNGTTARRRHVFGTLSRNAVPGLRHHWKMDEAGGLTAVDSASGSNASLAGFERNDDAQWVPGLAGGALDLGSDATTDNYAAASVPAMSAVTTGGFTIALWIRPGEEVLKAGEYQLISTPGDSVGFTIYNNVVEGTLFDRVLLFWDGNLANLNVGTTSLEPGLWYHVAITSTGPDGEKLYYVNGEPEERRFLVPSQGGVDVATSDGWAAGTLEIGGIGGAGRTHDSAVDDVRVYEVALGPEEIKELVPNPPPRPPRIADLVPAEGETFHRAADGLHFTASPVTAGATIATAGIRLVLDGADVSAALVVGGDPVARTAAYQGLEAERLYEAEIEVRDSAGGLARKVLVFGTFTRSGEPGLRHHWRLDETAGLVAVDHASGANGDLTGFENDDDAQWVAGQVGGGLDLGADATVNNAVRVPSLPALSALATGGFTIALWIQPGEAIRAAGEYQLFSAPGNGVGFTIMNRASEGVLHERVLLFWDGSLPNLHVGTTSLEPRTWYHAAVTSTGAGGERLYYLNGVPEERTPWAPSLGGQDTGTADGWPAGAALLGGFPVGRRHDSVIDDVRIYDAALDAGAIARLAGAAPPADRFQRGDVDQNGSLQLTDAVQILGYLFLGSATRVPDCRDAADTDDNGQVQLTDAVRILAFLFLGGAPPAPPGAPPAPCGPDPTLEDALDCSGYAPCR